MTDRRVVLLGMNNPLSMDPKYCLYPYPKGCTGSRVLEMIRLRLGISERQYIQAFDRRNVMTGSWRSGAPLLEALYGTDEERSPGVVHSLRGREVVVMGAQTRDALSLDPVWVLPQEKWGVTWRPIPHPSGRNLWYNESRNREIVSGMLAELYVRSRTIDLEQRGVTYASD